jgi:hypothetical protein
MWDNATTKEFPIFTTGNYVDIGDTGFVVQSQEQGHSQILASLTKIIGGHNLKISGEFKWNFLDYSLPGAMGKAQCANSNAVPATKSYRRSAGLCFKRSGVGRTG